MRSVGERKICWGRSDIGWRHVGGGPDVSRRYVGGLPEICRWW